MNALFISRASMFLPCAGLPFVVSNRSEQYQSEFQALMLKEENGWIMDVGLWRGWKHRESMPIENH